MASIKGSQQYNGGDFVFGELRMGFIRQNKELMASALRAGKTLDELVALIPVVHASLIAGMGKDAPAIEFFDNLTPDEMSAAIRDTLKAIGYVFRSIDGQEPAPSGEASTA